jgi:xanthine dehydrogenase accessory factor
MTVLADMADVIAAMKRRHEPYALATVVRTVSATAAKAGAKAVILADGTVGAGWIGGGCARGAVLRAAKDALADGQPRLVSVQPEEQLRESQVEAGETRNGVQFARNFCASKGTMDVFVEPVLPLPRLRICGASPVAMALATLAPLMGFEVAIEAPATDHAAFAAAEALADGYTGALATADEFIVITTQGRGDSEALKAAFAAGAHYTAFVGSARKVAVLKAALQAEGCAAPWLDALHAPAGLDLGAVTAEEIALSILAEIVRERRRPTQRAASHLAPTDARPK